MARFRGFVLRESKVVYRLGWPLGCTTEENHVERRALAIFGGYAMKTFLTVAVTAAIAVGAVALLNRTGFGRQVLGTGA